MANATLNHPLQSLGSGDAQALALKQYAGMLLTAYETATVFGRYGLKHQITSGNSHQFPRLWKTSASEHTAGTEIVGVNAPITKELTIAVDSKELVSANHLSKYDDFIAHYDTRAQVATEHARAIARTVDVRLARQIILGARQSASGPSSEFPAGNLLTSPRTGPIATAYPATLTGSKAFQSDMEEIAQKMDEKDVPRDGRVGFITPYIDRVLRQDDSLLSNDYQSVNGKLERRLIRVAGFELVMTNQMPSTNVTTETDSQYNGDFSTTVACFIGDNSAFGQVFFTGIEPLYADKTSTHRAWMFGAAFLQGAKWLRTEACGEIAIA